jgi:hypothetical protein
MIQVAYSSMLAVRILFSLIIIKKFVPEILQTNKFPYIISAGKIKLAENSWDFPHTE